MANMNSDVEVSTYLNPGTGLVRLSLGDGIYPGPVGFDNAQLRSKGDPWYNVKAYGAVGDGVTDDTVAINAAIAAVHVSGGTVWLPAGTYKTTASLTTITKTSVSIIGAGSGLTTISPTSLGSADTMRVQINPFSIVQAGKFAGFTIDGTNAGSGKIGLHFGDVVGAHLDDLRLYNFSIGGGTGMLWENATNWTERTLLTRVHLDQNNTGWKFIMSGGGATSFGYTRALDVKMNVNASAIGIDFQNTAFLYNSTIRANANVGGASATVLKIGATASVTECELYISAESLGGASTLVNQVSGSNLRYTGYIRGDATCTNTIGNAPGIVGILSLGPATTMLSGDGVPTKPLGLNPSVGDFYFRRDTPTTANQRIYICTTGGGAPVWAGIV